MPPSPDPTGTRETVSCAGDALTIEVFALNHKDADTTPTIILLHDAHGAGPDRPVRTEAARLAAAGYRVVLPHYLERTGATRVGFSGIARHFGLWSEAIGAVIAHLRLANPARPLGLVGRSLGGALALAAAAETNGLAALVLRSAFLPPHLDGRRLDLPPVLALHGTRDVIVPPSHATNLAARVREAGGTCGVTLYETQAHTFDDATDADATARLLAFLAEHLRGAADRPAAAPPAS
ncbi:alpha/beta hydrolase family protein [Methylobacterium soli]|nr:dienelactone hydrolase family protein [Methylobacterium soli]GJE42364.1 hypothetical protein AEGHOMDF_1536 [Methylobacterium soli]